MNSQERDQLSAFLKQLSEARVGVKDDEADGLIREAVAKQPDAAYLLVQRALLMDQALNVAKSQIAELQKQAQAAASGNRGGGFLGGGNPWVQPLDGGAAASGVPGAGNYQIPRGLPGSYAAAPAQGSFLGGGGGSFLGNVATTAAGVVAGSFLFQGLESLLGHHAGQGSFWGGGNEPVAEQTIINNYYDSPGDGQAASQEAWAQNDEGGGFFADDDLMSADDDTDDSSWV